MKNTFLAALALGAGLAACANNDTAPEQGDTHNMEANAARTSFKVSGMT